MGVLESARALNESGVYDVVVVGGGIAGVAAAVSAARNGARVILLERSCALGGLATLGHVIVWLPLCDGRGRQVTAGLAEEMLRLSVRSLKQDNAPAHLERVPACWEPSGDVEERKHVRFQTSFSAAEYLLDLETLVVEAGVKVLYDTRVCAVKRDGTRVTHVIVENKSGRSAVGCSVVIDTTGDADVCALAGEETESLDGNVLCGWFYSLGEEGLRLTELTNGYNPRGEQKNATGPFFRGDDAEDVTAQILGSRQMLRRRLAKLREAAGEGEVHVVSVPAIACCRMARRRVGSGSRGGEAGREWFEDTVGLTGTGASRGRCMRFRCGRFAGCAAGTCWRRVGACRWTARRGT